MSTKNRSMEAKHAKARRYAMLEGKEREYIGIIDGVITPDVNISTIFTQAPIIHHKKILNKTDTVYYIAPGIMQLAQILDIKDKYYIIKMNGHNIIAPSQNLFDILTNEAWELYNRKE